MTSVVEDVYKIDFGLLNQTVFDRASVTRIRQVISAMVGTFEGYDGDIFDVREKEGLLRYQMRLLSGRETATGWEDDREGTFKNLQRLGLHDAEGRLNFPVLKAFGDIAQRTYLSAELDQPALRETLHRQFPGDVEAPQTAEIS